MQANFEEATSQNLPKMDFEMITDFFVANADFYAAEIKNKKSSKAARETYGSNAIAYVQVRREEQFCHIKAQITPEHKIRSRNYNVHIIVDEKEEFIVSAKCLDCQASEGGCKHSVAVLFWLHRISEKPAVTEVECYWRPSSLSKVGSSLKFLTLKDVASRVPSSLTDPIPSEQFFQELMSSGRDSGSLGLLFKEKFGRSATAQCSIHQMFHKFKEVSDDWKCPNKFIQFIGEHLTDELCEQVEKETRSQDKSQDWFEARFGRVTASTFLEVSRCQKLDGSLLEKIMGASKVPQTPAIKRGKELEAYVLDTISKVYNWEIEKTGMFLKKEFGLFGASPDGLTQSHCIEVKCPFKETTIKNYVDDDGNVQKKGTAQLQLQMFLTGRKSGYFCVASPKFEEDKSFQLYELTLDEEWVLALICQCTEFWKKAVFPKLCK